MTTVQSLKGVKCVIAVASGKGGVGKSTTTVNLALALTALGKRVGLLDADIYGPNQPLMLGTHESPKSLDAKTLEPVERYGIQSMSIGYLLDADNRPVVWRGPMASSALQQMLRDTNWHDLDILLIDLPPGTGDIHLTLSQKIPVNGAVIVTTPQEVALLDAQKAIMMFRKVRIPVLGIIENMSYHVCSSCGHRETIFSEGGGERLSQTYEVDVLAHIPLDKRIREQTDSGKPTVIAEPESDIARYYSSAAERLLEKISLQTQEARVTFPKIVVVKKEERS
jgi:ATP-binding protein involved in chromosome partitioning